MVSEWRSSRKHKNTNYHQAQLSDIYFQHFYCFIFTLSDWIFYGSHRVSFEVTDISVCSALFSHIESFPSFFWWLAQHCCMLVRRYPVGMTLIQTLFSKILGARPQGTWMGWMVASGSVARIIGDLLHERWYDKQRNWNVDSSNRSHHHIGRLHKVRNQLDICCDYSRDAGANGEPFLYQKTHSKQCPARRYSDNRNQVCKVINFV